ncbi:hypothetical protein LINPERPRIM_LOCUS21858 [Linum perenne]
MLIVVLLRTNGYIMFFSQLGHEFKDHASLVIRPSLLLSFLYT